MRAMPPASDLTQERVNLAAQQAVLPALEQQELETRDALAILLGRPPEGFDVSGERSDRHRGRRW